LNCIVLPSSLRDTTYAIRRASVGVSTSNPRLGNEGVRRVSSRKSRLTSWCPVLSV